MSSDGSNASGGTPPLPFPPNSNVLSEIYVYDQNPTLRPIGFIKNIITSMASSEPTDIFVKAHGFIVKFGNDVDCNFIFEDAVKQQLGHYGLKAALSKRMQAQRVVYIPNSPHDLMHDSLDEDIAIDVEYNYGYKVLEITRFSTYKNIYITITFSSKHAVNRIADEGVIKFLHYRIVAEPKKFTTSVNYQQSGNTGNRNSAQWGTQRPSQPHYNAHYRQSHAPMQTYRDKPYYNAPLDTEVSPISYRSKSNSINNVSSMQYKQTQPHWVETNTNRNAGWSTQVPSQSHKEKSNLQNANFVDPSTGSTYNQSQKSKTNNDKNIDLKHMAEMCRVLSSGLNNPDLFVFQYNLMCTKNGYDPINVPEEVLVSSKAYYNKKIQDNIVNITNSHAKSFSENKKNIMNPNHQSNDELSCDKINQLPPQKIETTPSEVVPKGPQQKKSQSYFIPLSPIKSLVSTITTITKYANGVFNTTITKYADGRYCQAYTALS